MLVAIAVATFVAALAARGRRDLRGWRSCSRSASRRRRCIGGITVLTDLNPWVVSFHLLLLAGDHRRSPCCSCYRLDHPPTPPAPRASCPRSPGRRSPSTWAVLYVGTVVTGSGPHAGDASSPRNGLDPLQISQLHADLVFLLVGLTVGLLVRAARHRRRRPRRSPRSLRVEVVQGAVGFVQYFTDLPVAVVMLHMLGAALVVAASSWRWSAWSADVDRGPREHGGAALAGPSGWTETVDDGWPAPPWARPTVVPSTDAR